MPKISVISIAKRDSDFERLRRALANQTFHDFELVTSTKGSIPEAWNDAISKAKGEILVFVESDAFPLNNNWLEEIVKHARRNAVLKGLEINPTDMNLCNLVCDASIFKKVRFDESFKVREDMELFARLRKMGVEVGFINAFPVVHVPTRTWRKTLSRALISGMYYMKIIYMHGRKNIDDINTQNFRSNYINPISNRLRIIVENLLILLGLPIGAIIYLPILVKRKLAERRH
jgi:glycosyltransferase involved in cell wall biosynthesis